MTKICTQCKVEKELTDFYKRKGRKDGRTSQCKKCSNKYSKYSYRKNWEANRERIDKNHYSRIAILRQELDEYKSKHGCAVCKYNTHPVALEFHHIDPDTKYRTISSLVNRKVKRDTLCKEINKCIILCANCHRLLHNGIISCDYIPLCHFS